MTYLEDSQPNTKELIEFCFNALEDILEKAKVKICTLDDNSDNCVQLSKIKTNLTTLKNEFIEEFKKDPSAILDEATAQLQQQQPSCKMLIEQLLAKDTIPIHDKESDEMDTATRQHIAEQNSTPGSANPQ